MNKEQFLSACERTRRGFLTALQCGLTILIIPALLVVVLIILIDNAKYKSTTNVYTVDGYTLTGRDWSKKLNLGPNTINSMFRSYPKKIVEEFIHKRLQNPSLKRKGNASWLEVYNL